MWVFSGITAPAATTAKGSKVTPFLRVDPIPTKLLFFKLHDSKTELGPIKTSSPIYEGLLLLGLIVTKS